MSQNLDKVLIILERVKRSGKGWVARCPAHEDRHPSLSVGVGDDGRVLLHCYAGCDVQAVVAALGLQMADLYPDAHTTPPSTRATVQHQPANPHPSADSAVAGNDPGGSAEGTVAPLQPDQQGMCVRVLGCTSRPTRRRSGSRSISCVRLVSPTRSTWMRRLEAARQLRLPKLCRRALRRVRRRGQRGRGDSCGLQLTLNYRDGSPGGP